MIDKELVYGIVIIHFLFDWILQPRAVAERKASSAKWMAMHGCIIAVGFGLLGMWFNLSPRAVGLYVILHVIQDKIIWGLYRKFRIPKKDGSSVIYNDEYYTDYESFMIYSRYAKDPWWYRCTAIDQVLHLVVAVWLFTAFPVG